MSSSDPKPGLAPPESGLLLDLAWSSIRHGLTGAGPLAVDLAAFAEPLQVLRASFVSLHLGPELRGCIGSLEARRPLALDVAHNAHAAAFRDPRFPPVSADECKRLSLEISLLTPAEPLAFGSEAELLAQLAPMVDGLILEERGRRGTFLPVVWEMLPEPRDFLAQLKRKAGLPAGYWSDSLRAWRYRTEVIG
jgi:AmmeMemoRadiSam system protein A